jgi:hypothetical protein
MSSRPLPLAAGHAAERMPDLVVLGYWSALPDYFDLKESGWEPWNRNRML